ncbi:MAG: polyhydroxyalkanoate synthesis repressor PhaR [Desulfobacteraceae bacterium]|nr:polyhydroxyalkanoate synthesis repressor PhaR [Desulfobacteraceae bacterium]
MPDKLVLKKYPNRRLYDTEKSTYVTLTQVADIIKQGRKVEVIDLKTNEDVTAFILTQIIMEQVKKNNSLLPVSLLHLIIRFGEGALSEFFEKYLEKSIESYLVYKKGVDDQFKICLELGMDFSSMAGRIITPFQPFAGLPSDETPTRDEVSDKKEEKDEDA